MTENQAAPPDQPSPPPDPPRSGLAPVDESPADPSLAAPEAPGAGEPSPADDAPAVSRWPDERGLLWWLVAIVLLGAAGLLLQQPELAVLVALAGLYVAAQAADFNPGWTALYYALSWVVPASAVIAFSSVGYMIAQLPERDALALAMGGLSVFGGAASMLLVLRPVSDPLCRLVFAREEPSHALRLTLRLAVAGVLFALPGWYALRDQFAEMLKTPGLLEKSTQGGSVIGMATLAIAAVGYRVRRDWRGTCERLGLRALRPADLLWIVGGVAGIVGLTSAADWIQSRWFHALWERDREITQAIVSSLRPVYGVLLGLGAGIGEEITMRGALQPKLGVVLTALLFAGLHIQYSWYGMLVIFALGAALGLLRNRTSTTVAIVVHSLYDVLSVFTS